MIYQTRDFGEIEIEENQMIDFRQPIYGFDEYSKYAVLHDSEMDSGIAWLQSLEEPGLCFVLVSSKSSPIPYEPVLPGDLGEVIGEGEYECWLIAVIHDEIEKSTLNLKSPLVINWKTGQGAQIILEGSYPVRQPLIEEAADAC